MGALTSVVAVVAFAATGLALYRFAEKKSSELKNALREAAQATNSAGDVIELEKDPHTGVYSSRR